MLRLLPFIITEDLLEDLIILRRLLHPQGVQVGLPVQLCKLVGIYRRQRYVVRIRLPNLMHVLALRTLRRLLRDEFLLDYHALAGVVRRHYVRRVDFRFRLRILFEEVRREGDGRERVEVFQLDLLLGLVLAVAVDLLQGGDVTLDGGGGRVLRVRVADVALQVVLASEVLGAHLAAERLRIYG